MSTIELVHRVQIPPEASSSWPAPVVVMVHGWKGDETVMWIFKQAVPPGVAIITPRAPLAVGDGGYGWFQHENSELEPQPDSLWAGRDHLQVFLAYLPQQYPVDPARMVLMGFSQGAAICNTLALTQPGQVIGVASLAGLIPGIVTETAQADLGGLPVFIAHGTRDETVPLAGARQAREIYTRLGAQVTYGEYPTGHKLTTQGMADLKRWLAEVFGSTSGR
ncbi:MAG: dienelactone hydrolase family protein [Chloroflexi bacterium]|nr:dienelactone hydrolase family protein [Chloroflexota bacterium]